MLVLGLARKDEPCQWPVECRRTPHVEENEVETIPKSSAREGASTVSNKVVDMANFENRAFMGVF
jgi:hypothetical protein